MSGFSEALRAGADTWCVLSPCKPSYVFVCIASMSGVCAASILLSVLGKPCNLCFLLNCQAGLDFLIIPSSGLDWLVTATLCPSLWFHDSYCQSRAAQFRSVQSSPIQFNLTHLFCLVQVTHFIYSQTSPEVQDMHNT